LCVDQVAVLEMVERARPDFVFIDRSEGLRYEDFAAIGALEEPTTIFDASQYVTPILEGRYDNPLEWGFDLMLFSLHKVFPGPQKAAIVGRENGDLWRRLATGLSTLVSSSHAESSYLAGLTLLRREWLTEYVRRLMDTAVELERRLARRGIAVVDRQCQGEHSGPATHHIWIRSADRDTAFAQFEALARVNIHVNYRKLPYGLGFGLRLGTAFSAVAGVDVHHVDELADIMHGTLCGGAGNALRRRVRDLARHAAAQAILPAEHWN
jgi:glycine hydroxymethyltransferase